MPTLKIRHFLLYPLMTFLVGYFFTWGYELASVHAQKMVWTQEPIITALDHWVNK